MENFKRRDKKKIYAELVYLAWEAHLLRKFIERLRSKTDQVVIIPNLTYGGLAISPVRHILERDSLIWDKYMRSSTAHKDDGVINPHLFSSKELNTLRENSIILIIDGSYSIDTDKVRSLGKRMQHPKYPDSHLWFRNYFEASTVLPNFLIRYFSPCSKELFFSTRNNYIPVPKALCYDEEAIFTKNTGVAIFYQSCVCHTDIPQYVKSLVKNEIHSPGYFDFLRIPLKVAT